MMGWWVWLLCGAAAPSFILSTRAAAGARPAPASSRKCVRVGGGSSPALGVMMVALLAPAQHNGMRAPASRRGRERWACFATDGADRTGTDAPRGLPSSAVPRRGADRFFVDRLQVCSDLSIKHERDPIISLIIKLSDSGAQGRGKWPIMKSQGWMEQRNALGKKPALCEC